MPAGWWANRTTPAACVAAVLIAATGFVAAPSSAAEKPVIATASTEWGDGLNHFVVIPDGTVTASEPTPEEASARTDSFDQDAEPDSRAGVSVPAGSVLSRSPDDEMIAITPDGRLVPLGRKAEPETPVAAPRQTPSAVAAGRARSQAFAESARRWPGTGTAEPLFDGMISLATSLSAQSVADKQGVAQVREDALLQMTSVASGQPNDVRFGQQWMHVNTGSGAQAGGWTGKAGADSDAPVAWASSTGAGVVVADVDSGVDIDHSDLSGRIWRNVDEVCGNGTDDDRNGYVDDCNGWDAAYNDGDPRPDGGGSFGAHGTHVGGIIGATGDNGIGVVGMAPDAQIMAIKIGTSNTLPASAIAAGVRYAVDNGAQIINASWGVAPGTPRSSQWFIEDAVRYAQSKDVLFVAAAGNDGTNIDLRPSWPAGLSRYYDNVVTVGASTNSDGNANFSNYGPETVDLHAPGYFIQSTVPGGYGMMSGTSMAAPAVAGASALIRARNPAMSAAQVKEKLRESADVIPELRGYTATGRLNAGAAVTAQPLTATFEGFGSLSPDEAFGASVKLQASNEAVITDSPNVELTVATADGESVFSVADLDLTLSTTTGTSSLTTDDDGQATMTGPLGWSGRNLDIRMNSALPAGRYALMLQLRDASGNNRTNGVVSFFDVASPEATPTRPPVGGGNNTPSPGSGGSKPGTGTKAPAGGSKGTTRPTPAPTPEAPDRDYRDWPTAPRPPASGGTPVRDGGRTGGSDGGNWVAEPGRGSGPAGDGTRNGATPAVPDRNSRPPSQVGDGTRLPGSSPRTGTGTGSQSGGSAQPPKLSPDPAPVTSGGWSIERVRPRFGNTSGGNLVTVTGKFPRPNEARVTIGGSPAPVAFATTNTLYVTAPSHIPGVVDVSVRSNSTNLTMRQVYTYVSAPPSGGSAPAPDRAPGSGSGGGTGSDGSGGGSTGPGIQPAPGDGNAGGDSGSGGGGGAIRRGDLRLVPMRAGHPLSKLSMATWEAQICRQPSCAARPVV